MTRLSLFSEPFAPTGNMAGEGFRRLLGRPALGLLQTVLRESLQNVVDAAVTELGPRVHVRIRTLSQEQKRVLVNSVLSDRPVAACSAGLLESSLARDIRVLEIADSNTLGLSGPSRADLAHDRSEPPNFVNFFRNVGADRDAHHGGGTYGYGKSAFYAISQCATVFADSVTTHRGQEARRFFGCHLGAAFDVAIGEHRKRYTGRHWWGIRSDIDGVDPLEGRAAAELAGELGLYERAPGETGTTVVVLDPELPEDVGDDGIAKELIEGILWNFWPRMTRDCPPRRRLSVVVEVEGREWQMPTPETFPPLDLFARAMSKIRSDAAEVRTIQCAKPQKPLGRFAVERGYAAARDVITERPGTLVPKQSCHIALMRPVELVVKYLKGTPFPDSRFEWAGVFLCSDEDEVEWAFAQSEPPAHDDWVPDNLPKGREKTFVNVALKRLKEEAATYVQAPGTRSGHTHSQEGLVAASGLLGNALVGRVAEGPGRPEGSNRGGGARKRTALGSPLFERLALGLAGETIARFKCSLRNAGEEPALTVVAHAFICVDGGGDATAAAEHAAEVVGLSLEGSDLSSGSERLEVGCAAGQLVIDVRVPGDAAVGVKLELMANSR